LLLSTLVFGLFQLGTAWATSYSSLVALRLLCGLGLGGAMPNLIALTAEASASRNGILNVVITVAGMAPPWPRRGSAAGPFFAGLLLGGGASETRVLEALLPVTAIAASATVALLFVRPPSSQSADS
jgi:MFS family permease